jgi:hypothetical protein
MSIKSISVAGVVCAMCALAVSGLLIPTSYAENDSFDLRTLRGAWGYSGSGEIAGMEAAVVGRVVFDGNGRCTNVASLNIGGSVIALTSTAPGGFCSYTVNSEGTGSLRVRFIGPGNTPYDFTAPFVIVDDGDELRFMAQDSTGTTVASGVTKRQKSGGRH